MNADALQFRLARSDDAAMLGEFMARNFLAAYGHCSSPRNVQAAIEEHYGEPAQLRQINDPTRTNLVALQGDARVRRSQGRLVDGLRAFAIADLLIGICSPHYPKEQNMKSPIAALCLGLMLSGSAAAKLEVGTVPPDLLGKTPEKQEIRLSQYKGKIVVVTFWASWCGPCRRELPVLDVLQKAAGDRVSVIAVNVKDTAQDYRIMRKQMKDASLTFTHDTRGNISDGFDVKSYPNLYVIDQTGTIAAVHVGFSDESLSEIIEDINKLLVAPAHRGAPAAPAAPVSKT